jgi:hypothetical protein
MHPQLTYILAQARDSDRARAAAHLRNRPLRAIAPPQSIVLRLGLPADADALGRLAALDSTTPPPQPVLLAELDGRLAAALALSNGTIISDPFQHTSELIALLRTRARQLHMRSAA